MYLYWACKLAFSVKKKNYVYILFHLDMFHPYFSQIRNFYTGICEMYKVCMPIHILCVYIISEQQTWNLLEIFNFQSGKVEQYFI